MQEHETQAIDALLRLGARPSLSAAAGLGDAQRVRELLTRHDATTNGGMWSPEIGDAIRSAWYNAAASGHVAVIDALLDAQVIKANDLVGHGTTALHLAAWSNHRPLVERLLERGADTTVRDKRYDATAADWARHGGHDALAQWLREQADRREVRS